MYGITCTCNCPVVLSTAGMMFILTSLLIGGVYGFAFRELVNWVKVKVNEWGEQ